MKLTIENYNGQLVADSREVAAMLGRQHGHLARSIRTYCRYLNQSKIGVVDFFIPATYKDEKGENRPCYKLTERAVTSWPTRPPVRRAQCSQPSMSVLFTLCGIICWS